MLALRVCSFALILVTLNPGINAPAAGPEKDQDMLNQGKELILERKWDQAHLIFDRFAGTFPKSPLLAQAYFLSARCLQWQGKDVEAIRGYELFLEKFPNEKYSIQKAPIMSLSFRHPSWRRETRLLKTGSRRG